MDSSDRIPEEPLDKAEDRLRILLQISGMALFDWDVQNGVYSCSGDFERLYGLEEGTFPCTCRAWAALIHPEDAAETERRMKLALKTGHFEAEWRVKLPNGTVRWLGGRGHVSMDREGHPLRMVGINIDITDQKMLEHELNQTNIFLERMMQSVSSVIFVLDREGSFVQLNDAAFTLTEYDCADILHHSFCALLDPKDVPAVEKGFLRVLAGEADLLSAEVCIIRKNGERRDVALSAVPLIEENEVTGLVGAAHDITERKRAEEALRISELKYRTIFDSANDGLFIHCAESGRIIDVNIRAQQMYGLSRQEMCGLSVAQMSGPGYDDEKALAVMRRVATGEPELFEWLGRNSCGRTFWVEVNLKKVELEGKPSFLAVVRDISERKQTEHELLRAKERLSLAQDAAGIGMWTLDLQSGDASFSDRYFEIMGIEPQEISFDAFLAMLHPDDREHVRREFEEAMTEARQFESEFRVLMKDGSQRWITGRGKVFKDETGTPQRVAGAVFDNTERKLIEEGLKTAMEELARSNRELEQFANIASHDLQEPLRMVSGYLRLLEKKYKGALDEKADQFIRFAVDGAERMQNLVEGLLTWSRITARMELRQVDTSTVFAAAVANLEKAIEESGAQVTHSSLPLVQGDDMQLLQLFQNLIANALKYRKPDVPPRIDVSARREGKEWVFSVRDNGIGIEAQYFERIFQLFQRLHTQEEYKGTGIGLASCKKIVERHHGRIWVESVPGKGSVFFFTIPL